MVLKRTQQPDEWDETPIEEQLLHCPVCGDVFLEMNSAKTHFATLHGIRVEESLFDDEDFKHK